MKRTFTVNGWPAGLDDLRASVYDDAGALVSTVTTGFAEISAGQYQWTGTFEDAFVGSVLIYSVGTAAASVLLAVEPETIAVELTEDEDTAEPETIADAIAENAKGPKRVQGDELTVEQHPIQDQIAADEYQRKLAAAQKPGLGIRFSRVIPPGAY